MILERMLLYSLLITGVLIFAFWGISCKSTESLSMEKDQKITIGSFGGFAGAFKEYTIHSDGLLSLRSRNNGNVKPLSKLEQTTVTQFFSILTELNEDATAIYNPGNMTYFIKLYKGDNEVVEWVWGGGEEPMNQIQSIYRTLTKLCKSQEHPIK